MRSILRRILDLLVSEKARPIGMFAGFVDSLLQKFENCRGGLSDETLRREEGVRRFFVELYEREAPRLQEVIRIQEMHRSASLQWDFFTKVDELVRRVVIPGYARLAGPFTVRERNDFYRLAAPLHGLERFICAAAGLALGAFVVWAPFIPLWSKEWCLVFAIGGLIFPDGRRLLSLRRYEADLNHLAQRADDEIRRIEQAYYLIGDAAITDISGPHVTSTGADPAAPDKARVRKGGE